LMSWVLGNMSVKILFATLLAIHLQTFAKVLVNSSSIYFAVTLPL
jgi:hypothetical protein